MRIVLLRRCSTILRILTRHSPSTQPNEVYSTSRCLTLGGGDMPRPCWLFATACLFIIVLGFGIGRVLPQAQVLRFADTLPTHDAAQPTVFAVLSVSEPEAPAVSANSWLMHNGWKQI